MSHSVDDRWLLRWQVDRYLQERITLGELEDEFSRLESRLTLPNDDDLVRLAAELQLGLAELGIGALTEDMLRRRLDAALAVAPTMTVDVGEPLTSVAAPSDARTRYETLAGPPDLETLGPAVKLTIGPGAETETIVLTTAQVTSVSRADTGHATVSA